jgi:proteasome lid subunit RPN8/RPN11
MRLTIAAATLQAVYARARSGYPEEVCGALLGRWRDDGTVAAVDAMALDNSHADGSGRRYFIGPNDVRQAEQRAADAGLEVVGYYHSHPDAPARPSRFDREHGWPWYTYLIVSVRAARCCGARAWRLSDDRERFVELGVKQQDDST